MAQGQFTKEEAKETENALNEVMRAFPKGKLGEFLGHFNDIFYSSLPPAERLRMRKI